MCLSERQYVQWIRRLFGQLACKANAPLLVSVACEDAGDVPCFSADTFLQSISRDNPLTIHFGTSEKCCYVAL